jgi:hypothetical protein
MEAKISTVAQTDGGNSILEINLYSIWYFIEDMILLSFDQRELSQVN